MYSKDFKAKNRDVIEHYYLQQQGGPVFNTRVIPLSLSYKKMPPQILGALRANNLIIFKTSLCMGSEP